MDHSKRGSHERDVHPTQDTTRMEALMNKQEDKKIITKGE